MRTCGTCTLCCTLTLVPELNKPERVTCEHCDNGCRIYEGRPKACSDYQCAWLAGEMSEFMRPDLSHVMVERYPLMVAALLETNYELSDLGSMTMEALHGFVEEGLPVIATGQFAKLPVGMSAQEAKDRMVKTIREVCA